MYETKNGSLFKFSTNNVFLIIHDNFSKTMDVFKFLVTIYKEIEFFVQTIKTYMNKQYNYV
jgi:hypothetical protein